MKLRIISSAVAAALYGAGSLHAAVALDVQQRNFVHQLQAPNIDVADILKHKAPKTTQNTVLQDDGLNMQINRQHAKFVAEEGLSGEHVYIIRLHEKPVAQAMGVNRSVSGSVNNRSIHSASNKLFVAGKATSPEVSAYRQTLLTRQAQVINSVSAIAGSRDVRRQFTNAINGFTMTMTQAQAQAVSQLGNVASVQRSKTYELFTDAGPELIKADKIWTGEATDGIPYKGEGQIVAIIDTGVNTDHPSFAEVGGDGYTAQNPWGNGQFVGDCTKAGFETLCNNKLIGVRSYPVITDNFTSGELGATRPAVGEDYQGHGSHTASTAAGNVLKDVDFQVAESAAQSDGSVVKAGLFPQISGVAPHANIISYQVCHPDNDVYGGCPGEALLAGIEDAISDGVDVINFSIGGQDSNPWADDIELAFLAAREAGISVATAAGNSGQASGYDEYFGAIDHASPWLLDVAATTHDRTVAIETKLTNPIGGSEVPAWSEIVGGAVNQQSVTGVVVQAKDYGNEYCGDPFADNVFADMTDADGHPTDVIVVCKRNDIKDPNGIARTLKADNVKAAGGDGMIMYNYANGDPIVSTAVYSIPSAHITKEEWDGRYDNGMNGYGLTDWLKKGEFHTLTIGETRIGRDINPDDADWLAAFSSRGPSVSTPEALIPAVSAPGVNIYAAFADEHPFSSAPASSDFASLSGTSMASPHVAGSMALIRQAHPDWTATEIQSALAMTADNVVKYRRLNKADGDVGHASTYRAGTGRINVANAVQAGLIMDETVENFKAADPNNGGAVHKLNLPQLVDFSCKPTCQWVRTVKATKDGSWSVTHDDVINWAADLRKQAAQNGVEIKVNPSEFSLKAGETQTLVIEASIAQTQDLSSDAQVELHSNLVFTETSAASPEAHWPVVFKYDNNKMPSRLEATAHLNAGSTLFKGIAMADSDTPYARAFEPAKAEVKTATIRKDDDAYWPYRIDQDPEASAEDRYDDSLKLEMVDVPVGAKRIVAEVYGTTESPLLGTMDVANVIVMMGRDDNGNGEADMEEEILCMSTHSVYNNFCSINDPKEGQYWVAFYNSRRGGAANNYYDSPMETFKYGIAVVEGVESSSLSVSTHEAANDTVNVQLDWHLPEMQQDDVYYSVMDFGTSQVNAGNIGKVPLKLTRGVDYVSLSAPNTGVKKGDDVPLTFSVLANNTGADRPFSIKAQIPAGLNIKAEDVLVSNKATVNSIVIEGSELTMTGTQPDTSNMEAKYNITTNIDDAMCKTPDFGNANPGGYVDLAEFGIYPAFSGFAPVEYAANGRAITGKDNDILTRYGIVLPVSALFNGAYDTFHLYNNTDELNVDPTNAIELRANGFVALWKDQPMFFPQHYTFPYGNFPLEGIGMLWRGIGIDANGINRDILSVPLDTSGSDRSGISLASTGSGWGIIEYDNARSYGSAGKGPDGVFNWTERDDRFDFEVIFNANTRFGDNEYELIMAYDNLDFGTQDGRGSIGLQGFKGAVYPYGALEGTKGENFAYNDLDSKLKDGLVICYDYVGPESSQFEVTAWSTVNGKSTGQEIMFKAVTSIDGMADTEQVITLSSPSNISLGAISDKSIDENTSLEDLAIIYADEENSVNTISVSGEHITAVVNGHTSGSTVTITPDADFNGEVEVTVTVSDVENPTDAASTRFMLTVVSDGVEPVTPTAPEVTTPENTSSGGGALGGLAMLFALAAMVRRRVTHK